MGEQLTSMVDRMTRQIQVGKEVVHGMANM